MSKHIYQLIVRIAVLTISLVAITLLATSQVAAFNWKKPLPESSPLGYAWVAGKEVSLRVPKVDDDQATYTLETDRGTSVGWLSIADDPTDPTNYNIFTGTVPDWVGGSGAFIYKARRGRQSISVLDYFSIYPSPTFETTSIANQIYTQNEAITALTLPALTTWDLDVNEQNVPPIPYRHISYSLSPALPAGLSFNATTRQITGTPTTTMAETEYTYTVTDGSTNPTDNHLGRSIEGQGPVTNSLKFKITVRPKNWTPLVWKQTPPTAGTTYAWVQDVGVSLRVPKANDTNTTYTLQHDSNATVTWLSITDDPTDSTNYNVLTGTVPNNWVTASGTFTYIANRGIDTLSVQLSFSVYPSLIFDPTSIANQIYTQNEAITALTLPDVTTWYLNKDGQQILIPYRHLSYSVSPALPAGLSFNATTRQITGTPTTDMSETEYTYTVTDGSTNPTDNDQGRSIEGQGPVTSSIKFKITVLPEIAPNPTIVENTTGPVELVGRYTYQITGTDADSQKFELQSIEDITGSGATLTLNFKSTHVPDYETPTDADADNNYVVTLKVKQIISQPTISPNGQPSFHTQQITISVTDVAIPAKMAAPTLTAVSAGTATVSWTASTHTQLTGYKVKYAKTAQSSVQPQVPVVKTVGKNVNSLVLALNKGSTYNVQVQTLSLEGDSEWSDSASVTIPNHNGPSVTPIQADALPTVTGQELTQLAALFSMDTVIFNELRNASYDAHDYVELRNISNTDVRLDGWKLTITHSSGKNTLQFPENTVVSAGAVLLLLNTYLDTFSGPANTPQTQKIDYIVNEALILPQTELRLSLESPTEWADVAGNYTKIERLPNIPALTVDTAWKRVTPIRFGYEANAWRASTATGGFGTPGYQLLSDAADLNNDGTITIVDLVLVASQFGSTTSTPADLNRDGSVDIRDLVLVANALNGVAAAPAAHTISTKEITALQVQRWLTLAKQNANVFTQTSIQSGIAYNRGISILERLASELVPKTTALLANYPNPFNPETWIPYELAHASEVTLTIYAADGSTIRTLALGHQAAGKYHTRNQSVYWDGKNELGEAVASGVYFYTLTADDFTATRKMLILK